MMSFLFLRHGETEWNVADRVQGLTDNPLNANGLAQAHKAAAALAETTIDQIICSPLQRAQMTAAIIGAALNAPVTLDDRLLERDFGGIEGWTPTQMQQAFSTSASATMPLDTAFKAESMDQLAKRAEAAIMDHTSQNPGQTLLFVAHGTWFRAFTVRVCNRQDIVPGNAVPYYCTVTDDRWQFMPL